MHTCCCCNVLVGRDCTTRLGACELLDCTWILEGEAAGPNGLGNSSRREVRVGIEFSFAIVGSEGGLLGKGETPVLASRDRRHRDRFCRLVSNLGGLITAGVGGSPCNLKRVFFLDCSKLIALRLHGKHKNAEHRLRTAPATEVR